MASIKDYASMVKFSHTIFAMPFALVSYVYAIDLPEYSFELRTIVLIVLCMVFARNTAMGFNRLADRKIDALNPRTAEREIPAGIITPRAAATFITVNAILFLSASFLINKLTFALSPIALAVIISYSLTKRFTSLAHLVLGLSLSIAPVGAFIAVTGNMNDIVPFILAALVLTWVGGFDILYALQDREFDRKNNLHSIPARFSLHGAKMISICMHAGTLLCTIWLGCTANQGVVYWIGAAIFIALLCYQQWQFSPSRLDRIGRSFGLVNGLSSVLFAAFAIVALLS